MKQFEAPLRNMSNILATCIELYNLCIISNEGIEDEWIVEVENKLSRRIKEGEIQKCSEL